MNNIKKNRTRGKSYFNKDLQGTNIYKNIEPRNGVAKADGTGCCNNPNVGCGVCKGCTYTITPATSDRPTQDVWNSLSMYLAVNPTQKSNLEAPCNWDYTAKIISPLPGSATGFVTIFTISIESNKCIDKNITGVYIYPSVPGGQGTYIGKYTNCDSGVTGTPLIATPNSIITKGTRTGTPYINPIAGWRKAKCDNPRKIPTNTIYADNYTDCSSCEINKGIQGRTFRPIIRSGMQEKKEYCKISGKCEQTNKYSFSYRQYQNNKRCLSFERSLEKIGSCNKDANGKCTYEYDKSSCCPTCAVGKSCKKTIYKPNNKKFSKQGAVSSGSRLDRLKLNTIRSARSGGIIGKDNKRCNIDKKKAECKDGIPKGKYFAGKPRFTGYYQRRPIGLGWSVAAKRNVRNARK
jgi:hypothetical protein